MGRHSRARWLLGLATLLFAASCAGGDDSGDAATAGSSTTAVARPSTTAFVSADADEDEEEEETVEDLEAEWAERRNLVIGSLSRPGFGIDEDNLLLGPGRFEIDLDGCPAAWADDVGIESDSIRIAMTTAQTGQFRYFSDVALGMQAYFDYVNANGGVDGRQIELVVHDDGYDGEMTVAVIDELLADVETQPFYVTTVGSPGSLAVYDDLNDACVPHPFVVSAHPAWGDPTGHPFTTGFQMSYTTEAIMWGTWIKDNLPDLVPVKVGALVMDNEFGRVYADAFEAWAATNRDIVSEVIAVKHDPGALTVSPEMAELAEADPAVFLSMTAGQPCLSAIREAERTGLTESAAALFTPSGCREPGTNLAPAGDDGHGFWAVGGGVKSTNDPAYAEETFIKFANEQLTAAGLDPSRELIGVGFAQYGWAHVETLRVAAELPGGLTRSNLVLALRGADYAHPMLLDRVRFAAEGAQDAFFIEGGEYSRYDSESETWFQQGAPVDIDGTSPNCAWERLVCRR